MRLRILAVGGVAALLAPAIVSAQANSGDSAANWAAIAACAAMDEAAGRHRCMDDVARRAGVLSEARVAQAAREDFGREERPRAVRSTPVPTPAARAAETASSAAGAATRPAEIQELATTVASVRTVGYRKLRVTTAEGSVWDQMQAETFTREPRAGEAFSIVRGALGGFRCQFGQASRYQCERVG